MAVAEQHLRRAYKGFLQSLGPADLRTIVAAAWLAELLTNVGETAEAEKVLTATIETARRELGPDHDSTLGLIADLAFALHNMGRHAEVVSLTRDPLARARARYPGGHHLVARLATRLGVGLKNEGYPEAALEYLREARTWARDANRSAGTLAMNINDELADALRRTGRRDEAERIVQEQVAACRELLGDDHDYTAWAAWSLGQHYLMTDQPQQAEAVLREAYDHFRLAFDRTNPWVLWLAYALGDALRSLGRVDDAIVVYWEAAEGWLERRRSTRVYFKLAGLYLVNGRAADAEEAIRRHVERTQEIHSPNSMAACGAMYLLAHALLRIGPDKLPEAERWARPAREGLEGKVGTDHATTLAATCTLGAVLSRQGRHEDAASMFEAASAGVEGSYSSWWVVIAYAAPYGRTLTAVQRFGEAETLLLEAYEQVDGPRAMTDAARQAVLEALIDLYDVWGKPGKAAEYRALLLEADGR
jgi:tetratricopeptide (TPR) repeat protein